MTALLITIHIVACLVLILVVLLQAGKGADMGAALGGAGSSAMFGASTASNPLARITTVTAIMFMTTSLMLAVVSARQASVFDNTPEPLASPTAAESSATQQGGASAPGVIPATGEAAPGSPESASPPSAASDNAQPIAEAADSAARAAAVEPPSAPAVAPGAAALSDAPAAAPTPSAAAPTPPTPNPAATASGEAKPVDQAPSAP